MMKICYKEDFDYSSLSGNVYGTFYIQYDDKTFPDNEWCDFPIIVLRTWSEIIFKAKINGYKDDFTLDFFDGPFSIYCSVKDGENLVRLLSCRSKEVLVDEISMEFDDLAKVINNAAAEIIKLMKDMKYSNVTDLKELKLITNKLRQLI